MDFGILDGVKRWKINLEKALETDCLIGRQPYEDLLIQLEGYIEALDDPTLGDSLNNYKLTVAHPIDNMGCGSLVIRMRESGLSPERIAQRLTEYTSHTITTSEVESWLASYSQEGASRRRDMTKSSIFDTSSRLEDLFVELSRLILLVESEEDRVFKDAKTTRWNVLLDYKREMRQLAKDAADVIKAIHEMASARELCRAVVEVVGQESPSARQRIYQRLEGMLQLINLYQ